LNARLGSVLSGAKKTDNAEEQGKVHTKVEPRPLPSVTSQEKDSSSVSKSSTPITSQERSKEKVSSGVKVLPVVPKTTPSQSASSYKPSGGLFGDDDEDLLFGAPEPKKNIVKVSEEDLGDDDMALGPHLGEKPCDRFLPLSVVLVRCHRLQNLLILQGTTKSAREKSQELLSNSKKCREKSVDFCFCFENAVRCPNYVFWTG